MTLARPRAMESMASVAMNGGSLAMVIPRPFTRPAIPPTAIAATMLRPSGHPALWDVQPSTIIARARTAPTDRSMPPVMMTKVMPRDRMPRMVTWARMLSRLLTVKKNGEAMNSATHRAMRTTSGPAVPPPSLLMTFLTVDQLRDAPGGLAATDVCDVVM